MLRFDIYLIVVEIYPNFMCLMCGSVTVFINLFFYSFFFFLDFVIDMF